MIDPLQGLSGTIQILFKRPDNCKRPGVNSVHSAVRYAACVIRENDSDGESGARVLPFEKS